MSFSQIKDDICQRKTRFSVFLSSILSEPLFTIYGFTALILRKHLDATAFQVSLLISLKPLLSILSFYWSSHLSKKPHKLRANFLGAGFLARLPFLFFPFVESSWFLVVSAAIYMLFSRAGTPAWMEILKINLPKKKRERIFSAGYTLSYIEGMILVIGVGSLLDSNPSTWKILFFVSALLGLINLLYLSRLPINQEVEIVENRETWKCTLKRPWKKCFELMRTRPDFAHFQWGFMFCGAGIMLVQPAIALYLADTINISFTEWGIATTVCKGIFIALSSPVWSRLMNKYSIFTLSSWVFVLVGFLPFFLLFSSFSIAWVYLAYLFYGIAQGGSHLIWHLSGPSFSGEEDSSIYSGVNVMMVGVRGAVAPALGGLLCVYLGPLAVLAMGALLCVYSGFYIANKKKFALVEESS